jgi:hypothetical protein
MSENVPPSTRADAVAEFLKNCAGPDLPEPLRAIYAAAVAGISASAFRVLVGLILSDWRLSEAEIALLIMNDERSVRRAMDELEAKGFLDPLKAKRPPRGTA